MAQKPPHNPSLRELAVNLESKGSDEIHHDIVIVPRVEAAIQCDLLDRASVNALPDVENVVFMAGMKFGSATQDARMTCSAGRA